MSKYDDFTGRNIFYQDEDGNTIYPKYGSHFIINDNAKQEKLQDLEGYGYFFYDKKPVSLFLSLIFIAIPLTFFLQAQWFPSLNIQITPFIIAFGIHTLLKYLYNKKIKKLLVTCSTLAKEKTVYYEKKQEMKEEEKRKNTPMKKNTWKNIKEVTSDYNIFHIILFLLIAGPFLFFALMVLREIILG